MARFPRRSQTHGRRIVAALLELGFFLTLAEQADVVRGKDFVQIGSARFSIDLVFAPDGIESFDAALRNAERVENFPVMALPDIIASKGAAGRKRDLAEMELPAGLRPLSRPSTLAVAYPCRKSESKEIVGRGTAGLSMLGALLGFVHRRRVLS